MIRKISADWDRFWFAPRSTAPLAAIRIIFGLFIIYYYATIYWFLKLFYAPGGLFSLNVKPYLYSHAWSLINSTYPGFFDLLFGLTIAAAAMVALGALTPLSAAALWVLTLSWLNPLGAGTNSADLIVRVLTFLFMVAAVAGHLSKSFSIDQMIRDRFGKKKISAKKTEQTVPTVPLWSTRLFQIQLVMIYFFSGLSKCGGADWLNGTAMSYVFGQTGWSRMNLTILAADPILVGLITYGSLFFELILFPVLVWPRATRLPILIAGILFHLGIGMTMRIITFTEVMPILYLFFLDDDHWESIRKFLSRWVRPLQRAKVIS